MNPYSANIIAKNVNPIDSTIENFLANLSNFEHSKFYHSMFLGKIYTGLRFIFEFLFSLRFSQ